MLTAFADFEGFDELAISRGSSRRRCGANFGTDEPIPLANGSSGNAH
jgi:hypothetical protein